MSKKYFKKFEEKAKKMASQYALRENLKNGIAYWGQYNDLPNKYLAAYGDVVNEETGLSMGSTWNGTAIDGIVKLIMSNGLSLESNNELPSANLQQESLNDILEKLAYDWKILGGGALQIIWTLGSVNGNTEPSIAEIYHIPFKNCRASEVNDLGRIPGWYVSPRWGARRNAAKGPDDAKFYPNFNPGLVATDGDRTGEMTQVLVYCRHNPNSEYYPEPDYKSGLIDIFTDSLVRKSKTAMLNNSIVNSSIIQVVTAGMTPDEANDYLDDLEANYESTLNHGTPMFMQVKDSSSFNSITPPGNLKNITEAYTGYEENVQQRILSAHGVTFSETIGVAQSNGGLAGDQIQQKFATYMNFSIRPHQSRLLSGFFNKIIDYVRPGDSFVINPIDLFEALDGQQQDIVDQEEDTTEQTVIPQNNG